MPVITVSDLRAALADCGDTLPLVINGAPIAAVQLQGLSEGRVINIVTDPTQFVPDADAIGDATAPAVVDDTARVGLGAVRTTDIAPATPDDDPTLSVGAVAEFQPTIHDGGDGTFDPLAKPASDR